VQIFSRYLTQGPKNGVVVWSLTGSMNTKKTHPYYSLAHKFFEVHPYTPRELWTVLNHYKIHRFLKGDSEKVSLETVTMCQAMSDGVGKELFKYVGMRTQ